MDEEEIEAYEFANNALIDKDEYNDFASKNDFSSNCIEAFANDQKVPPFIVVGRLQKEGLLSWDQYNYFKTKIRETF